MTGFLDILDCPDCLNSFPDFPDIPEVECGDDHGWENYGDINVFPFLRTAELNVNGSFRC